jgi:hypothetical protein
MKGMKTSVRCVYLSDCKSTFSGFHFSGFMNLSEPTARRKYIQSSSAGTLSDLSADAPMQSKHLKKTRRYPKMRYYKNFVL